MIHSLFSAVGPVLRSTYTLYVPLSADHVCSGPLADSVMWLKPPEGGREDSRLRSEADLCPQ